MEQMFELDVQVTPSTNFSGDGSLMQDYTSSCFCTIAGCW